MQLADVCYVIDALGPEQKKHFQKWFCEKRIAEYSKTFPQNDDVNLSIDKSLSISLINAIIVIIHYYYYHSITD